MRSEQAERLQTALTGRYAIGPELGAGGMATVYLADDLKHHRQVALKLLTPQVAAAVGQDRFLREIRIAAHLSHPHILPLYDSGQAGEFLFYVMPYVKGESLRQKLARERQLAVTEALTITRHVASALGFAHRAGVIHRDIKPENILLHEGEAMVADFGIALPAPTPDGIRLTEAGGLVGTLQYMSPEQVAGDQILDARSDIYSLACVLYEMLTGEAPHTGPTVQAVIAKRLTRPAPDVRQLRHAVPVGVQRALSKALATAPADRFASVDAFAEALSANEPIPPGRPSVAVLPFLNLSPDPENEFFADGITEDVIAQLSLIRSLKVISRTSVMRFKQREHSLRDIGTSLETSTILDGSVRRSGDRVRIVAQLIDVETDRQLWAETYDRQLTDIFAIQSDVALRLATALQAELTSAETGRIRREPTTNFEAYQLYIQGRHCVIRFSEEGIRRGIEFFRQAIARDPRYAMAHVGLALAYIELGATGVQPPGEANRLAREAAHAALALDRELGEAHCVLAQVMATSDFDWVGAEREFKQALALTPNSADAYDLYGRLCGAMGRFDEALVLQRRAQELDPFVHRVDVATALLRAGIYDEALTVATHAIELDPHYARAQATLGWAFLMNGLNDQGLAHLQKAVALAPDDTLWLAQLGQAYGTVGDASRARAVLGQLEELSRRRYVSPYHLAYVLTGLGEQDRAMDCLEQAFEARAEALYAIKGSFLFTALHSHPRFIAMLGRMNLT